MALEPAQPELECRPTLRQEIDRLDEHAQRGARRIVGIELAQRDGHLARIDDVQPAERLAELIGDHVADPLLGDEP